MRSRAMALSLHSARPGRGLRSQTQRSDTDSANGPLPAWDGNRRLIFLGLHAPSSCVTVGNAMASNATDRHDPAELGELERAVLELVWKNGTQSADQVRECLDEGGRRLKESTIRTVLRRLEEK